MRQTGAFRVQAEGLAGIGARCSRWLMVQRFRLIQNLWRRKVPQDIPSERPASEGQRNMGLLAYAARFARRAAVRLLERARSGTGLTSKRTPAARCKYEMISKRLLAVGLPLGPNI